MTSPVELVAAVRGNRLRVTAGGQLPLVLNPDGGAKPHQVFLAAGDPQAQVLAPPTLVRTDPPLVLHLVAIAADIAAAGWLDVERLDELHHPLAVAQAIRIGLAQASGQLPWPAARPDWFRRAWQIEVDTWIDAELTRVGRTRSGPSALIQLWGLSSVLRTGTTTGDAVFLKASCGPFL